MSGEVLPTAECWRLLEAADVGRLAVAVAGDLEIFPVTFVVDNRTLVFRTAEGTKLAALTISSRVALEVDGYEDDADAVWSVVVKGTAERLDRFDEIYAAEELPIFPWASGVKQWFVRIRPAEVSGRRFPSARREQAE